MEGVLWYASCEMLILRAVLFLELQPSCAEQVIGVLIVGLIVDRMSIAHVI